MHQLCSSRDVDVSDFLKDGLSVKQHLSNYLNISIAKVEESLPQSIDKLAGLHPGALLPEDVTNFYEDTVGTGHLFELASWHLTSSDYIAETLRLQGMWAHGQVLDFGGGIGTHALSAAVLPQVDHVWFVDLNPHNQSFVKLRANALGLSSKLSVHRDLSSISEVLFDTVVCLDVLEHLPNPSAQLLEFHRLMKPKATALLNWYFFKGENNEYPFHFDDLVLVDCFFRTLQEKFLEIFHPLLITTRLYRRS